MWRLRISARSFSSRPLTSSPLNQNRPLVGTSRQPRMCIRVDLPGPGRAHDRHVLAVIDGERHAAQGGHGQRPGPVDLGHVLQPDDRLTVSHPRHSPPRPGTRHHQGRPRRSRRRRSRRRHRPPPVPVRPVPPPRMLRPEPVEALNLTTRSMTTSPALTPLVIWVSPPVLMPVVTGCDTWEPPTTLVTVDCPLV